MSQNRISQVAEAAASAGLDAFLAWSPTSLGYIRGLHEHPGHRFFALCIKSSGEEVLICPALSESQARRIGIKEVWSWKDGEDALLLFEKLASDWNLKSAMVAVDEDLPALHLLKMQKVLPAALFCDGGPMLNGLRRRKTEDELILLRKAAVMADETFNEVWPQIRAGMTERDVEKMLFAGMESKGGTVNFGIVGTGAGGAEPHHATDSTVLQRGDVVILDFGCDVEGYRSDITRTIAIGHASDLAKEIYKIVYQAHHAGKASIRPGATLGSADAAARKVVEEAGYGPQFMHRLGHGIGLQGHELPYLMPGSEDLFQVGDCFSIEPGIYLSGQFGVRLENIYTCTESGAESLDIPIPEELPITKS